MQDEEEHMQRSDAAAAAAAVILVDTNEGAIVHCGDNLLHELWYGRKILERKEIPADTADYLPIAAADDEVDRDNDENAAVVAAEYSRDLVVALGYLP